MIASTAPILFVGAPLFQRAVRHRAWCRGTLSECVHTARFPIVAPRSVISRHTPSHHVGETGSTTRRKSRIRVRGAAFLEERRKSRLPARELPELGDDGHPSLANQLPRRLVEADDGRFSSGGSAWRSRTSIRATNSASTFGMHHIFFCHGFSWFSVRRRRTVSVDSEPCFVRRTISPARSASVQRARPADGRGARAARPDSSHSTPKREASSLCISDEEIPRLLPQPVRTPVSRYSFRSGSVAVSS